MSKTTRRAAGGNGNGIGRTLPHSLEAEQYVLSCCFIDGANIVARCLMEHVTPNSFYFPTNGIIYEQIVDLYHRGATIEVSVVAEELKAKNQLEEVGSYGYLSQVSSLIPTTAQASYFIQKVKQQSTLRELIREHTSAVEAVYAFVGDDLQEFISTLRQRMDRIVVGNNSTAPNLMTYPLPVLENDPAALIGRYRYVSRGDTALLVGPSGMGKSSLSYEWAIHLALGRPYLGMASRGKWRSLIIQSEDSDGDIGEIVFSVCHSLKLTKEEKAEVASRTFVVTDRVSRGAAFLGRLRALVDKYKPDLVWLNPLHAFAGCDIADATEIGAFLREGLNNINAEGKFAYIIVHHTTKPVTGKHVGDKKWNEYMYDMAGSAELVNWARAVITIKPTDIEGFFNLVLAKRGRRAGVTIEVETAGGTHLEPTIKIPVKHSTTQLKLEGRKDPFHLIHWEARDPDVEKPKEDRNKGRPPIEEYDAAKLIVFFPASTAHPETYTAIRRFAMTGCGISSSSFLRRIDSLKEAGLIQQRLDTRWNRTVRGDSLAADAIKPLI